MPDSRFALGVRVMDQNRAWGQPSDLATSPSDAVTPWPLAPAAPAPSLVMCPVPSALMMSAQDIYRIAYEQALASTRRSRFELASKACPN